MTKFFAYFYAILFWVFFPIRWWEGKPVLALFLMLISVWFISAGHTINAIFYVVPFGLFCFELITLPRRFERETKRMSKASK